MGCFQCGKLYDLDWTYKLDFWFYNLYIHVLCILPVICIKRHFIQWSGSPLQRCRACCYAGTVYRNVPGRLVCRIHVEPDISHSHDSYTKASVYPEPCIRTSNIAYHDRYCSSDCDSVHTIWSCTWSCCFTGIIFCISDPMYSAVHDAGNKLEKSICPLLWRTALGGGKNELERIMDDTFWNLWLARTQYGILGIYGCCAVDRNTHECGILGNKAKE